jgi:hypothetical protein
MTSSLVSAAASETVGVRRGRGIGPFYAPPPAHALHGSSPTTASCPSSATTASSHPILHLQLDPFQAAAPPWHHIHPLQPLTVASINLSLASKSSSITQNLVPAELNDKKVTQVVVISFCALGNRHLRCGSKHCAVKWTNWDDMTIPAHILAPRAKEVPGSTQNFYLLVAASPQQQ